MFSGILRQDFQGIYFSFFYDPYLDNFPCKFISISHAKTNVAQMQFKNQGATQQTKIKDNTIYCMKFSFPVKMKNYFT